MKIVNDYILKQVDKYIEENKEGIIQDLLNLVRIPSVQSASEDNAPYGKACRQILDEAKKLYKRHGFDSEISADSKYVLAFLDGSGKTIGIFAHGDVVPVGDDWLICKPFEPIIKDGYIFGRGCHDDKSGIIQAIYAAKMIRDLKLPFKSKLLMMTGSNEETGMADAISFRENEKMPDFSLVLDGEYPYYGGEKSSMKLDLISKTKFKTIKSIQGGKSYTIVLGKVKAELEFSESLFEELQENCKNNAAFELEKTEHAILVTAKGVAGHIDNIEKTKNAMVLLANLLSRCASIPENERNAMDEIERFIGKGYGSGFGIEHTDAIFGKLTCANGFIRTQDNELILGIDIRTGITSDLDAIYNRILTTVDDNWKIDFKRASVGYYIDDNLAFPQTIRNVYGLITGENNKKPILTPSGTYSRHLKNSCSIGTEYCTLASDIDLPIGHGQWHQPDERISIAGFFKALKILVCLLLEMDALE